MRAVLILSLTAAAVTACGGEDDTPFHLTHDVCAPLVLIPAADTSEAQLRSLSTAIGTWNALAGTRLSLEDPDPSDLSISRLPVRFGDAAAVFFGRYDDKKGEVFINQKITDHRRRAIVIAHELGHAYGLRHVASDQRISVMNSGNVDTPPTPADGAALRALGACSSN